MGKFVSLAPSEFGLIHAWRAEPAGAPKGGVVVIQEIFGVNAHIRAVADRFAAQGYLAIAPALFDPIKPGIELNYTPEDIKTGSGYVQQLKTDEVLAGVRAAAVAASEGGKVAVVGFCWGGTIAYLSACDVPGISAAVGYYGGGIAKALDKQPKVPVLLHFGEKDAGIPLDSVEAVRAAHPDIEVHTYNAGHGFNCDARAAFDEAAAALATQRTLGFLSRHLR